MKLVCRHFNLKFVKTGEVRLDSNLIINRGGIFKFKIRENVGPKLLKKPANVLKLVCRHFNLKFVKTGYHSNLLINSGGILNRLQNVDTFYLAIFICVFMRNINSKFEKSLVKTAQKLILILFINWQFLETRKIHLPSRTVQ